MPSSLTLLRAASVLAIATAQQCYYPNGSKAPEKPCSSAEGSACCPDKWVCLDNGMCHYPADNLYGRYSCTDKEWNAPGCPSNLCTYDMTGAGAGGGENMRQCSNHDDDWCCNANAVDVDCCNGRPEPRPFFQLQDGRAYATVGSGEAESVPTLSGITGIATSGGGGGASSPSRTSAPGSSNAGSTSAGSRDPTATAESVSATTTAEPFTSVATSVSSGTGGLETIYITTEVTPSATAGTTDSTGGPLAGNASSESGSSNLGVIIGCAVGIPLALALLGIILWMVRKRRNQKANPYKQTPEMEGSPGFEGGAAGKLGKKQTFRHSGPTAAEIDGNPVGAGRPVSNIKGHAELPSGNGFQPGYGTPYTPDAVGLGGGSGDANGRNTWGTIPPQYSPAHNQTAFSHPTDAMELDDTSVMPVINEKEQPQQYQAYRPPHPVAEMPAVTTPPEDVEKQMQR